MRGEIASDQKNNDNQNSPYFSNLMLHASYVALPNMIESLQRSKLRYLIPKHWIVSIIPPLLRLISQFWDAINFLPNLHTTKLKNPRKFKDMLILKPEGCLPFYIMRVDPIQYLDAVQILLKKYESSDAEGYHQKARKLSAK
jgi:hypothetical protein